MILNKDNTKELLSIISNTIFELVDINKTDELFITLSNNIYNNVLEYFNNNINKLFVNDNIIKDKDNEIKILKENKNEKLNIKYPNDMNNFINEVKLLNNRINDEYNDYLYQSLINQSFIDECINSSAMKSYYNKLINILNNYNIDGNIINKLSNDIIMIFINPGVKASIRGAKLNNIVDELISKIPEINNERFNITFENQPINVKCPERPDFVILDKSNNKEIVGYTQVDLWNAKYRADKYVRYNPHDNVFILCVVARKAVIEYKYSTENIRNVKYEVFKYGYEHNKVCYVNNLHNIICKLFNIQKNSNVNINDIVDFITNKRLSNINKINNNNYVITDYEEFYEQKNKRIEERNLRKENYINGIQNINSNKYIPLDDLKNKHFHFVNTRVSNPDFDIAIVRNSLSVGQPFLNKSDFKFNVNRYLIIKCDIDIQIVFNNLILLKDDLVFKARNKLSEGKTKPFINRDDVLNAYNDKFFN